MSNTHMMLIRGSKQRGMKWKKMEEGRQEGNSDPMSICVLPQNATTSQQNGFNYCGRPLISTIRDLTIGTNFYQQHMSIHTCTVDFSSTQSFVSFLKRENRCQIDLTSWKSTIFSFTFSLPPWPPLLLQSKVTLVMEWTSRGISQGWIALWSIERYLCSFMIGVWSWIKGKNLLYSWDFNMFFKHSRRLLA